MSVGCRLGAGWVMECVVIKCGSVGGRVVIQCGVIQCVVIQCGVIQCGVIHECEYVCDTIP